MILGILQTGHVPAEVEARDGDYTALYAAMFPDRGYDVRTFSVVDNVFPVGPNVADAWLISGSRHGAYEDHNWIPPLEALIRSIRDAGKPLIGICFGHQIIAKALGGKVEKFADGWAVGRHEYTVGDVPIVLNAWHQDQVVERPEGATLLGSSPFCENAVLAYGPNILTMQPHPEFTASVVEELIKHRSQTVPKPIVARAKAELAEPVDNSIVYEWLASVLEGADARKPLLEKAKA